MAARKKSSADFRSVEKMLKALGMDPQFVNEIVKEASVNTTCNVCGTDFPSVDQLSTHLDEHFL